MSRPPQPAGPAAERIERLNLASQANLTAALVISLLARQGEQSGRPPIPGEADLRELHRAATLLLVDRPGLYRRNEVEVANAGELVFKAPPWRSVAGLMRAFFGDLAAVWAEGDAVDVAAFALWGVTRIHPFRDGNGRTARAFAYACLCLKLGALLPGKPTVVELIARDWAACEEALRAADRTSSAPGRGADLGPLKAYLDELLLRQVRSAQASAGLAAP